ncbi:MAG: hypothetical protein IID41_12185, partial [Planctomycetes bacterium]|nr:hypothetical protein [Planctomycetota bacterium]
MPKAMNSPTPAEKIEQLRADSKTLSKEHADDVEFLLALKDSVSGTLKYYQDRLAVERLELPEAVMRRRLLYPTALAFEQTEAKGVST